MNDLFEAIDAPYGWQSLQGHEFANIFPLLQHEELDGITRSIQEYGWMDGEYITLYEGRVLDGRNRLAANVFGPRTVLPKFRQFLGTREQALEWSITVNLHARRHLTVGQKAIVGIEYKKLAEPMMKEKQRAAGGDKKSREAKSLVANLPQAIDDDPAPKSRDVAAKLVGVSPRCIDKADYIKEHAPDILDELQSGKLTLNAAEAKAKERASEEADASAPKPSQMALELIQAGGSNTSVAKATGLTIGQVAGIRHRAKKKAAGPLPGMDGTRALLHPATTYRCHSNDDLADRRAHQAQSPEMTVRRYVVDCAHDLAQHYTREEMKGLLIKLAKVVHPHDLQLIADHYAKEASREKA